MTRTAEEVRTTAAEQSTASLIRQATEQISTLVRDELRLAQVEFFEKAKLAVTGAGLVAGGMIVIGVGLGVLLAAAVAALSLIIPVWAACLAIGGGLVLLAGPAALWGASRLRRARPAMPSLALRNAREDLHAITTAARPGER